MRSTAALLLLLAACGGGQAPAPDFAPVTIYAPGVANASKPTLRWTSLPFSTRYHVRVWEDAARTRLLEERHVAGTQMTMARALADGQEAWVDVDALGTRASSSFRVLLLPAGLPAIRLMRSDPERQQGGYKLFDILDLRQPRGEERTGYLVLVNAAGEVVWWYEHPRPALVSDARVLANGNILFLVQHTVGSVAMDAVGYEMTWDGDIVWQSRPGVLPHHEIGAGPDGGRLYLTYLGKHVDGIDYEGDGLELVDPATNEVLWTWSIFDHFDPADFPDIPEATSPGLSGLGVDWSHSNAAVWDPDRGLIWVSIRHFDRIVGVHYPSGEIVVTLGEGGLGPAGSMSRQHAPEIQRDGSMLFFDNGNAWGVSSVKQISWESGVLTPLWTWVDAPPFFDPALGDADRLPNGNVLVTAGISGRLIEVDRGGDLVWELAIDASRHGIYRAQQVPPERLLQFEELVPASVQPAKSGRSLR